MLLTGIALLNIAGVLHCWYAGNAKARRGTQSIGYMAYGQIVLIMSALLLAASVILIWISSSFWGATLSAAFYFFVIPPLIIPVLRGLKIIPEQQENSKEQAEMPPSHNSESFNKKLIAILLLATQQKTRFIDINAGELHRMAGGYPSSNHRMPTCCQVMRSEMRPGDTILEEPKRGQGASLTIRYLLPRNGSNSPRINEVVAETVGEAREWFDHRNASAVSLANSNPSDPESQFAVGSNYKHGIRDIPKNSTLAMQWYRKAGEQGHAEAQIQLVEFFYYGDEVPQDYIQAASWARKAAEQGHAYGQLWIGTLYEKGQGVPQDYVQAFFWQNLAIDEWEGQFIPDREKYTSIRDETKARLTQAEISAVRKRMDRWAHDHPIALQKIGE